MVWDLILEGFWVPWVTFWWFGRSWEQVGISMDSGTLPGGAQVETIHPVEANTPVRGL